LLAGINLDKGGKITSQAWSVDGWIGNWVLILGHQLSGTIGQFVKDLELITQAFTQDEWLNAVGHLPF